MKMFLLPPYLKSKSIPFFLFALVPIACCLSRNYGQLSFSKMTSANGARTTVHQLPVKGIVAMSSTAGGDSVATVQRLKVEDFGNILSNSDLRSNYQIVDVREPDELQIVKLSGQDIINLPLSTAGEWSPKVSEGQILDPTKATICLCHHGMRSMRVANFLVGQARFEEVYNVEGGIHQFAVKVDPSIGTY